MVPFNPRQLYNLFKGQLSLCREGSWGSGAIVPRTPKLCTIWMCVVRFRPPRPYFRRDSPRHQLNWRMGGPQCPSEKCGGEKTVLLPWGIEFRSLGRRARSLVAIPTELSRPFYPQRKTGWDATGCNDAQLNPLSLMEIWSQSSQQTVCHCTDLALLAPRMVMY